MATSDNNINNNINNNENINDENVGVESEVMKADVLPEDSGKSNDDGGDNGNNTSGMQQIQNQHQYYYPIRRVNKDCIFFVHTGSCSFGPFCRFNHPVSADQEINNGNTENNGNDANHENNERPSGNAFGNSPRIPCKFYLGGFCKFGPTCRYNHDIPLAERMQLQQYNSLGLPHRMGERICSFYMRTGLCGFGGGCKFHHPEPVFIRGPNDHNPYASHEDGSAGITNARYIIQFPDSPHPYVATAMPQHTSFQYMHPWNTGYQVPDEEMQLPSPAVHPGNFSSVAPAVDANSVPIVVDHFPQISKAPLVLAKTPVSIPRSGKPIPPLNAVGLPLRPGRKVCWHYKSCGECKYGAECIFHHPPESTVGKGSTSEYVRSDESPETEEE